MIRTARLLAFGLSFSIQHSSFIISPAHAGCGCAAVVAAPVAVAQNLIVTQYAVPVAVPQYVVPVAPQSYVQYGGNPVMPTPAGRQATGGNETVEDRIAAKILARLTSAGVIKPEAIPSLVSKTCAGCHSGPQPKAGLDLSDLRTLAPDVRLKCIGRVLSDDPSQRMPPASSGKTLSAEDLGRLLQEFAARGPAPEAAAAPAPAPAPAK